VRDSNNPFADRVERGGPRGTGGVSLDVLVTPEQYVIEADLPGVELDDVKVGVEDGELTIPAIRKPPGQSAPPKAHPFPEPKVGELRPPTHAPGAMGGSIAKTLVNGVLTVAIARKGTHEQLS